MPNGLRTLVPLKLKASVSGLPRLVWVLGAISFLTSLGKMVATFLAVYLLAVLNFSENQIGITVAAYGAGIVTGTLIGGWASARLSAVAQMAASMVCLGAGFILLSAVASPLFFLAGIFACANFEGALRTPIMLLFLKHCAPIDRPRAHAVYYTAIGLGYAVGSVIGGLVSRIDFSLMFWASGGVYLAAAAAVLVWLPAHLAGGVAGMPGNAPATPEDANAPPKGRWPFIVLCGAAVLHHCVGNQRHAIYPLYLTSHYGLDTTQLGAIFAVNGLLIALMGLVTTNLLKHVDQRKVAGWGTLLLCLSLALLPVSTHIAVAFLLCVVMSVGDVLFAPSMVSLAYFLVLEKNKGKLLGVYFATVSACRSLGPLIGIWGFALIGATPTWLLCGVIGVVNMLVLRSVLRVRWP